MQVSIVKKTKFSIPFVVKLAESRPFFKGLCFVRSSIKCFSNKRYIGKMKFIVHIQKKAGSKQLNLYGNFH